MRGWRCGLLFVRVVKSVCLLKLLFCCCCFCVVVYYVRCFADGAENVYEELDDYLAMGDIPETGSV